jgi:hypothetical protein
MFIAAGDSCVASLRFQWSRRSDTFSLHEWHKGIISSSVRRYTVCSALVCSRNPNNACLQRNVDVSPNSQRTL